MQTMFSKKEETIKDNAEPVLETEKRPGRKRDIFISLLVWLMALGLIAACILMTGKLGAKAREVAEKKAAAMITEKPKVNVITLEMAPKPIMDRINLPGIVNPWVKLNVATEVTGIVLKKNVKEGDRVEQGDILAVIDSRKYENLYLSLKASHESAKAQKARLVKLSGSRLAKQSDVDNVIAQVKSLQAQMKNAKLDIENCTVRAPVAGIINRSFFEKGQNLGLADPVVEIIQMDRVKVQVGIPESDVSAVRTLNTFEITIDALGGKSFTGRKYFLSRTADSQARLFNLDIEVDNTYGEILPDMFARVDIVKKKNLTALSVPLYSILTIGGKKAVYVEDSDTSRVRPVVTGMQEGWKVEILEGLKPGDRVIVTGQHNVSDGQNVHVVREIKNLAELLK